MLHRSGMLRLRRLHVPFCILALWLGLTAAPAAPAQPTEPTSVFDAEAGRLLQRFVGPDAYGASKQNWDAVQDSSGVLYVANTDGVLTYDGHAWRTIPTANRSTPLALAADGSGRVFVGAGGDFGVLRPDSTGRQRYVSLLDHVPSNQQSFQDVERVEITSRGVFFHTYQRLFRWSPDSNTMQSWGAPNGAAFHYPDVVRDTLYVGVEGRGLMTVQGDSLQPVAGGEALADRTVWFTLPHDRHGLLVGTSRGLFVQDGASFRPMQTEARDVLGPAWIYGGERLRDGTIAVATIDRGLLLLAPDGTVRRHLHPRGQPVTGLYEDREGGLWALLDGGMVRYGLGAAFTEHRPETGLDGTVLDLARHDGTLYAATLQGAFRLQQADADTVATFTRIAGIRQDASRTPSWSLLSTGDDLFVGTVHGLARKSGAGFSYLLDTDYVYDLIPSRVDSSRLYAATGQGIRPVVRTGDGWTVRERIPGVRGKIHVLAQGDDGTLWAGTHYRGAYRIRGLSSPDSAAVDSFRAGRHGLPKGEIWPYRWQNRIVLGTEDGVRTFAPGSPPSFPRLDSIEQPDTDADLGLTYLTQDDRGQTWGFLADYGPGRWTQRESLWRWTPDELARLRRKPVRTIVPEEGGDTVWIGAVRGHLYRYVPGSGWPRRSPSTLVRQISTVETDSVLATRAEETPALDYDHNSVRLAYGAPSLVRPDLIAYQYRLEGQSDRWSDWTPRTRQTFRNLGPGDYAFAVRARTAYGDTTQVARYAFSVLPPWYRTWWAYGAYLLLAGALVAGAVQWRTRQLRRRQETLEATVAERTAEIEAQKERLAEQAERLQELDRAKTRFFANVSHEFRTPLTLILGPVRDLHDRLRNRLSADDSRQLSVVERNARRLLRLVDQLLGIARMEAGSYELDARPTDLTEAVPRIVDAFEPLADREDLTLSVACRDESTGSGEAPAPVYVDRRALEHVVGNLLSNAVKFTPAGGTVTVTVCERDDGAEVAVSDTGPGIPEEQQDAVFERFQQPRSTGDGARSREGAGIGLAFARDLADLHGGDVTLDSTVGEGTTVTLRLRRGSDHLPDDHLDDDHLAEDASAGQEEDESSFHPAGDGLPVSPAADSSALGDGEDGESGGEEATPSAGTKLVLVVDDNADVRRYVRSILEPEFSVVEAGGGEAGLERAREELPDVILADVMMPDLDGHAMTQRLKEDPDTAAIPVVMLTARAGTEDEVEGLQVGADDYVTKPFDAGVLQQRVGGVVRMQERLRRRLQARIREETASGDPSPNDASHDGASQDEASQGGASHDETSHDGTSHDESEDRSDVEREARQVIREHLTDSDFDVDALAEAMAMSRATLYRRFDDHVDATPADLITSVRMEEAEELLRSGEGNVTQVAYAVGYDRLAAFSRAFRDYAGHPPSEIAATSGG
jgi:signal transduction histidine kinase/DNA-binding response OmpR family regulator